ncbi:MAG: PLP-dependent aminotransferase family protein [Geobacteraceae bacterium]|nr:PLP-dependent aminotransferase family protein [Geobacteraceae bacterium]
METCVQSGNGRKLLYEEVAAKIGGMIDNGTFRAGDRVPSIRDLSQKLRVSANTVMEAYANLENIGRIEARPQSGFYVRSSIPEPALKPTVKLETEKLKPRQIIENNVTIQVMRNITNPTLLQLGGAIPNYELLPADRLNRILAAETRRFPVQSISYAATKGTKRLRTQIAKRSINFGCSQSADDLVITSGCVEAISLALQAICRPGDTVAIGSPVYYTFLNFLRWLGLKVLEIPSTPKEGMNLEVLSYAIRHNPVHACLAISNFDNPAGSLMPDEKKQELVRLLARHEIPLIEDDVYGDLAFGSVRPTALKTYDEKGLVLYCSSFSKTLAPGYRVGWIVPGRFRPQIIQLKALFNIATATPNQLAIAEFLTNGGYDHHLRKLRRTYSRQVDQFRDTVGRHFPLGTRVSRPEGGFVLWVELPEEINTMKLYETALKEGISIAPGRIFSLGNNYDNCLRLNAAVWSEQIEQGLETLGGLAKAMVL